jgi:mannose-1-phosphate guanylyltransferase
LSGIKVAILAGGQGTRFWPISRQTKPKQFLSISASGESLIQATYRRMLPLVKSSDILVVSNVAHKPHIEEHLPGVQIVCEPIARNTAAAIGLAALHIKRVSPGAAMILLPADHAVSDEERLRGTLKEAVRAATARDVLVTIGIKPTAPNTAYGYIKRGAKVDGDAYKVSRFYEKPSLERAKNYYDSPDFFWNSGMFVWRPEVILKAMADFMPALFEGLMKIEAALGTPQEQKTVAEVFSGLESVSIDFGVLEHARNCEVIAAQLFGWNDVGSWDAWAEHFTRDQSGNMVYGEALLLDASNCVVNSQSRLTALLGVDDLIVIDSGDALLVCPRGRVQDVKKIVEQLKKLGRGDLI